MCCTSRKKKKKSCLSVISDIPGRGNNQRNLVVCNRPQKFCVREDISIGFLAERKSIIFDVYFWVNARQHPPGSLLSCMKWRNISDGRTHLKITPESWCLSVSPWGNRPQQTSQEVCCCPESLVLWRDGSGAGEFWGAVQAEVLSTLAHIAALGLHGLPLPQRLQQYLPTLTPRSVLLPTA